MLALNNKQPKYPNPPKTEERERMTGVGLLAGDSLGSFCSGFSWLDCHLASPYVSPPLRPCGCLCTCVRRYHLILALTGWETHADMCSGLQQ